MVKKRALLIDDDKRWYAVFRYICHDFGYECAWANSIDLARNMMKSNSFDVIILDLSFPAKQSGFLPKEISEIDIFISGLRKKKELPVLISTGAEDNTKIVSVKNHLKSNKRSVEIYRKRDSVEELYARFGDLIGTSLQFDAYRNKSQVSIHTAFGGFVFLHCLLVFSVLLIAQYFPNEAEKSLIYFTMGILAFTASVVALLLFWGTKAITGQDVSDNLRQVIKGISGANKMLSKKEKNAETKG